MVGIVHGVVVGRYTLFLLNTVGSQYGERVSQVVTTIAANLRTSEVRTAHGRAYNRYGIQFLDLIDYLAQPLLVGCRGHCATQVNGSSLGCFADALIVGFQLIAVHARVLLVVVAKGDDDVVASLYLLLGCLPKFGVASARIAPALGIVY